MCQTQTIKQDTGIRYIAAGEVLRRVSQQCQPTCQVLNITHSWRKRRALHYVTRGIAKQDQEHCRRRWFVLLSRKSKQYNKTLNKVFFGLRKFIDVAISKAAPLLSFEFRVQWFISTNTLHKTTTIWSVHNWLRIAKVHTHKQYSLSYIHRVDLFKLDNQRNVRRDPRGSFLVYRFTVD